MTPLHQRRDHREASLNRYKSHFFTSLFKFIHTFTLILEGQLASLSSVLSFIYTICDFCHHTHLLSLPHPRTCHLTLNLTAT